jgi:SAM-dependent methyltransferase
MMAESICHARLQLQSICKVSSGAASVGADEPTMQIADFYDPLSADYHRMYADWEASIARQAELIATIAGERWGAVHEVLDVACGIGTQALGLAARGFAVTASDLSSASIERARREAEARGLAIAWSAADMLDAWEHHGRRQFDLVLAYDNAIPHLPDDDAIARAFAQMFACTRPGKGCMISVRDYEALLASLSPGRAVLHPQSVQPGPEPGHELALVQVWRFDPANTDEVPSYTLDLLITELAPPDRDPPATLTTRLLRTRYRAIGIARLLALMSGAGFVDVARIDGRGHQPILIGTRPAMVEASQRARDP